MIVPLFRVNPPTHTEEVAPESLSIPWPSLMIPVPAEFDQPELPKSRTPPEPTSKVRMVPPVPKEPLPLPALIVTLELTVMFPALVVAGFTVEFAVKKTLLLEVHAVLKGPLLEDPQVESVQFPETPSVRQ
jgi:hypothetical protein